MSLFQETFVGQAIYHLSGRRLFQYPEEQPGFDLASNIDVPNPKRTFSTEQSRTPTLVDGARTPTYGEGVADGTRTGDEMLSSGEGRDLEKQKNAGRELVKEVQEGSPNLVTWYSPIDSSNPMNWSAQKKVFVTFLICLLTFSVYIGSAIYSPGIPSVAQDFEVSTTMATLGLTLFVFGYGLGPMFLAPLSEIPSIGRNYPYLLTLLIFVALQFPTARAPSIHALLALRFLSGFFGSPALATGGATLSDMYGPAARPYAIGVWGLAAVCGPVLGPLVGGFAAQAKGWRWTIWPLAWLSAFTLVVLVLTLPETSSANILVRRARRLRRLTGNKELKSKGEIEQAHMQPMEIVRMTAIRPFTLNFEPIIFFLNLYIALLYAILYTWFESFPLVFIDIYGFSLGTEGLAYLGIFVGQIVTYAAFCLYTAYVVNPRMAADEAAGRRIVPENRLPPAFVGCFALPICLFWFGWTARESVHWIVPIIGSSLFSVGAFLLFNAVLNYLGDAYSHYAASVLAGNDLMRSYTGGAFPLFAGAMFSKLGIAGGNSLLGGLSIVMIPIPFVLYKYGARIRKWSKYADKEE